MNQPAHFHGDYLTFTQAADTYPISRYVIRSWVHKGLLKAYDTPADHRVKLINRAELETRLGEVHQQK